MKKDTSKIQSGWRLSENEIRLIKLSLLKLYEARESENVDLGELKEYLEVTLNRFISASDLIENNT